MSRRDLELATLLTKCDIEGHFTTLPKWQREAFQTFANTIADAEHHFPCIPGRQGFLLNQLRFCFLPQPDSDRTIGLLAEALQSYGECSRQSGEYTSLVAIFETMPGEHPELATVEAYEAEFWSILSQLHARDGQTWPEHIVLDPDHPAWEFVFHGEPYFAFCATPLHKARRSRHFPWFLIAFQPRFVFEHLNDDSSYGQKMKALIRKRLAAYDEIPVHPALKSYGQTDNHEWKQYFLRDDNSSPSKCPFLQHHQCSEGPDPT